MVLHLRVVLLGYINDIEQIIAACSRATRKIESSETLLDELTQEEARRHIGRVMSRGHEGISEFAYFIFSVSGISRVLTHQLVRHRIASYLQMSSRETSLSKASFLIPPKIQKNSEALEIFQESTETAREKYQKLIELGIEYEDARYLLPSSLETHISIAINARSLNHLFGLRLCNRAQWEIRELARQMKEIVAPIAPSLFWSEPRPCVIRGFCPEGKGSCGYWKTKEFQVERSRYRSGYPNE